MTEYIILGMLIEIVASFIFGFITGREFRE